MQITVTVTADAEGASQLRAAADAIETLGGKKAAVKKAKPVEDDDDIDPDTDEDAEDSDADEDGDEADDTEEDDEDEEPKKRGRPPGSKSKDTKVKSTKVTLEKMLEAFRVYVKKHDREKALKILAKYKAKAVKDIPEAKYAEVLALLQK